MADSFSEDRPLGWDPVARRAIGRAMEWPDSCPMRKLSAVLWEAAVCLCDPNA